MTQEDIESVARKIRATGSKASWQDLLILSKDAIGSLIDAFQELLRNTPVLNRTTLDNCEEPRRIVLKRLNRALILLTSEAQVSRWKSEALADNSTLGTR